MQLLQTVSFIVLAAAFCLRIPRAIRHTEVRLTWAATGVGALALLTLGTLVPQAVLDGPLGGHNLLKLVQTSLALVAIWLDAQAAIALSPTGHRMTTMSLAVIVALPAVPFLLIHRTEPTNQHFLDQNIRQFPAWLYATLYLAALVYVATRLLIAFRHHRGIGARLIKPGALAMITASVVETVNFTIELLGPRHSRAAPVLSTGFNLLFYLGICAMSMGIIAYASTRTLRQWQIARTVRRLETADAARQPVRPSRTSLSQLAQLYVATVGVRDMIVAGTLHPDRRQLNALRRGERIIAHCLADPPRQGIPTVTIYLSETRSR